MKKIFIALGAAMLLLGACTNQENLDVVDHASPSLNSVVNFSTVLTRVLDNMWEVDDRVGIYVDGQYSNMQYIVDNTAGSSISPATTEDQIYNVSAGELTYYAYYPYNRLISDGIYPIDISDQSDFSTIDLLYAKVTNQGNEVALPFEHALSRVYITLKVEDPSTDVLSQDLKVTVCNMASSSTFDLANAEFSATPTIGDITREFTTSGSDTEYTIEMLMIPTDDLSQFMVTFNHNGSLWESYFASQLTGKSWEMGKSYNYEVMASSASASNVDKIEVTGDSSYIYTSGDNSVVQLSAKVYPINTTNKDVTWSSSDEGTATVSQNGLVKGVNSGEVVIRATSDYDPSIYGEYAITVIGVPMAIGDFIYDDWSYSADFNSEKNLLGIVYHVNADGESGKMVYPYETASVQWIVSSSEHSSTIFAKNYWSDYSWTNTYSLENDGYGMVAMCEVYKVAGNFDDFPMFKWVSELNATTVDYANTNYDDIGVWYAPGEGCFMYLLPVVDKNPVINENIAIAGGDIFTLTSAVNYMSSSEHPTNAANYRRVFLASGSTSTTGNGQAKTSTNANYRVRAIMSFELAEQL